jgi:hypothetical protein
MDGSISMYDQRYADVHPLQAHVRVDHGSLAYGSKDHLAPIVGDVNMWGI